MTLPEKPSQVRTPGRASSPQWGQAGVGAGHSTAGDLAWWRTLQGTPNAAGPDSFDMAVADDHILTLTCPDKPGIIYAVTAVFASHGHNRPRLPALLHTRALRARRRERHHGAPSHAPISARRRVPYDLRRAADGPLATTLTTCYSVPVIVSNHPDYEPLAASYSIEFYHLPVTKDTRSCSRRRYARLYPAVLLISTIASYPPLKAPSPTTRPTNAALRLLALPRTLSPPTSTRALLSSSASRASTIA
ncbi:Formyltetrahydrofolate deformylase [Tolypocladium paradoxum]|uniref:Formyltetrahydrofolate deformylase n=1 Tax=Tolypocladium paradoxum TaxID=94208 RepID=A0A2S4L1R6_9HYPO|nr:Formyltetrahydrofolate deformylase [Tolypocladium paradoxum]